MSKLRLYKRDEDGKFARVNFGGGKSDSSPRLEPSARVRKSPGRRAGDRKPQKVGKGGVAAGRLPLAEAGQIAAKHDLSKGNAAPESKAAYREAAGIARQLRKDKPEGNHPTADRIYSTAKRLQRLQNEIDGKAGPSKISPEAKERAADPDVKTPPTPVPAKKVAPKARTREDIKDDISIALGKNDTKTVNKLESELALKDLNAKKAAPKTDSKWKKEGSVYRLGDYEIRGVSRPEAGFGEKQDAWKVSKNGQDFNTKIVLLADAKKLAESGAVPDREGVAHPAGYKFDDAIKEEFKPKRPSELRAELKAEQADLAKISKPFFDSDIEAKSEDEKADFRSKSLVHIGKMLGIEDKLKEMEPVRDRELSSSTDMKDLETLFQDRHPKTDVDVADGIEKSIQNKTMEWDRKFQGWQSRNSRLVASPEVAHKATRSFLEGMDSQMLKYPGVEINSIGARSLGRVNTVSGSGEAGAVCRCAGRVVMIDVNSDQIADTDKVVREARDLRGNAARFHFDGYSRAPFRYNAIHEFGHAVENFGILNADEKAKNSDERDAIVLKQHKDIADLLRKAHADSGSSQPFAGWIMQNMSGYSIRDKPNPNGTDIPDVNLQESLAEGWADVEMNGEKASPTSKVLHGYMLGKLKEAGRYDGELPDSIKTVGNSKFDGISDVELRDKSRALTREMGDQQSHFDFQLGIGTTSSGKKPPSEARAAQIRKRKADVLDRLGAERDAIRAEIDRRKGRSK